MTQRIERLGPLPQLPNEVRAGAGANDGEVARDRYTVDLLRCLEEWRQLLIQVTDASNSGGGGGGHVIQEEGSDLTQRTNLNFIGATVTATDNSGDDSTDITITGVASTMQSDVYTSGSGTWTNPGVEAVWIELQAGGGGGHSATGAGGGGAGELCQGMLIPVSGNIAYAVGAGGTAGNDGSNTTFGDYLALGGKKGTATLGGNGGGVGAGVGTTGAGVTGVAESVYYFGGSAGGGPSSAGGGSGGYLTGGAASGSSGGGAATPWGAGGAGAASATSTHYGAGGGSNGSGAGGRVAIYYIA